MASSSGSKIVETTEDITKELGDLLLEDNYSIEALIRQAQEKNLSLSELRDLLLKHQQDLNQTSVELFNNSYDRFFKLSHLITCLNEPIENVVRPIENYHNNLSQLCRQHDDYLSQIDKKISHLEETYENKQIASILIRLIKRRDRIFNQLNRLVWLERPSTVEKIIKESESELIEYKINCDSLERLTIELHHLYCEIQAITPTNDELIPIKHSLSESVYDKKGQLTDWFRDLFHEAMRVENNIVVDFVLLTYKQIDDHFWNLVLDKYVREQAQESLKTIDAYLSERPLSEIDNDTSNRGGGDDDDIRKKFKIRICLQVHDEIFRRMSKDSYSLKLDKDFSQIRAILERFASWICKLTLSDFRITGLTTNSDGRTNFLAKQNEIMRLLVEDCNRLLESIELYVRNCFTDQNFAPRLKDSFDVVRVSLNNVKNLQNLLER